MATTEETQNDSIRIVPLHVPDQVHRPLAGAPAAAPQLTYRNGPLLSTCQVVTIFWGEAWTQPAQAGLVTELNAFFDFVMTSALIDQLAEYSTAGYTIAHGKRIATATVSTPKPAKSTSDNSVRKFLNQEIAKGSVPAPTPNTLYFVYTPPGVKVVMGGSASCQAFCGYHNATPAKTFYAVMPYPGCNGCTGGLSVIDALTSTSSHELCEAITDPIPGEGWYDDSNGEIGDICAWQTKKLGSYTVQLEWSNKQNKCV